MLLVYMLGGICVEIICEGSIYQEVYIGGSYTWGLYVRGEIWELSIQDLRRVKVRMDM